MRYVATIALCCIVLPGLAQAAPVDPLPTSRADGNVFGNDGFAGRYRAEGLAGNPVVTPLPHYLTIPPPATGCVDANLQTTATATSSGGGATTYGPAMANDGIFGPGNTPTCCVSGGCWCWISAGSAPATAYYQLTWTTAQQICQIWVDTKPPATECGAGAGRILSGAQIQTWDGTAWVTSGTVSGQLDDWGYTFPSCVTTTQLRLYGVYVDPLAGGQLSNPMLYELKVYGCGVAPGGGGGTGGGGGSCNLAPIEAKLDTLGPQITGLVSSQTAQTTTLNAIQTTVNSHTAVLNALEAKIDAAGFEAMPCQIYRLLSPNLPGRPTAAGSKCLGLLPTTCNIQNNCVE